MPDKPARAVNDDVFEFFDDQAFTAAEVRAARNADRGGGLPDGRATEPPARVPRKRVAKKGKR